MRGYVSRGLVTLMLCSAVSGASTAEEAYARAFKALEMHVAALQHFETAVRLDASYAEAGYNAGVNALDLRDTKRAIPVPGTRREDVGRSAFPTRRWPWRSPTQAATRMRASAST